MAEAKQKKAVRPLRVALTPGAEGLAEVKKLLIEKGHEVIVLPELAKFDLVLGANAYRITEANGKFVDVILKSARKRKYGPKGSKIVEGFDTEGETR